jgi:hypothetical protein
MADQLREAAVSKNGFCEAQLQEMTAALLQVGSMLTYCSALEV